MTIDEYRNILNNRMTELLSDQSFGVSLIRQGLKAAYDISEGLYDTYGCSEKSEHPLMTNLQLATLLAKGYGQVRVLPTDHEGDYAFYETYWSYFVEEGEKDDDVIPSNVRIRKFGTQKWIVPTVEVFKDFMDALPHPFYVNYSEEVSE